MAHTLLGHCATLAAPDFLAMAGKARLCVYEQEIKNIMFNVLLTPQFLWKLNDSTDKPEKIAKSDFHML
jgi:hypothetical protein